MFNFWCWPDWSMGLNPILHLSPAKEMKCPFFVLCSTADDRLGWSMDSNPILHLSPAKEMKCSFLCYIQLLMIGWAGRWTRTPSITPLQPKQWNAHFCIPFNMWCWPDWSMDLNLIHHPSPAKKWNAHFCITFNFWWSARLVNGLEPHPPPVSSQKKWNAHILMMFNFWWLAGLVNRLKLPLPPLSSQKHEMLLFGLRSTSDDRLGWLMDSNPILHPSPAKKVKCSFLYYIQHLMLARLVNGLEPHPPLLSSQKYEMLIFGLCSTSDD